MPTESIDTLLRNLKEIWGDEGESEERPQVVVVDDDVSMREALGFILQDDYEVRLCSSAIEGVDAVDDATAVVILDVKMSGHDGSGRARTSARSSLSCR